MAPAGDFRDGPITASPRAPEEALGNELRTYLAPGQELAENCESQRLGRDWELFPRMDLTKTQLYWRKPPLESAEYPIPLSRARYPCARYVRAAEAPAFGHLLTKRS